MLAALYPKFQFIAYLQDQFTLSAWNEVGKVIVIILIINYYALLIIITFLFLNSKFMNFKFSSLQHVQLPSVVLWFLNPNVSLLSGCVSSGAVVFLFLLFTVYLPN